MKIAISRLRLQIQSSKRHILIATGVIALVVMILGVLIADIFAPYVEVTIVFRIALGFGSLIGGTFAYDRLLMGLALKKIPFQRLCLLLIPLTGILLTCALFMPITSFHLS